MTRSLSLVTPPVGEPLSLDEVKAWLRLDGDDEDAVLWQLMGAARTATEEYLRRALLSQTWMLTLDLPSRAGGLWWDGVRQGAISSLSVDLPRTINLPKGHVTAITSVVTYDTSNAATTLDPSSYRLDSAGGRLILNSGTLWPSNIRHAAGVEITYVAGYGDTSKTVPQPIRTGMLIHVASLYEQRGMCDDAMALPPGAESLLARYRILGDRRG